MPPQDDSQPSLPVHDAPATARHNHAAAVEDKTPADGRTVFHVPELCCGEEVRQIEAQLGHLPDVSDLQFDLVGRRLVVRGATSPEHVKRSLGEIGMSARPQGERELPAGFWNQHGKLATTVISGVLLVAGIIAGWLGLAPALHIGLLIASAVAAGWFVAPRAWSALRRARPDMHLLMTIAALGAAGIGQWAEGASVLFLFSVAQLLESWSMERSRRAIGALMELSPEEATVKRDGTEVVVSPSEVTAGEEIVIRPGQKVPLDGEVVSGRSAVNQSPITGESIAVDKEVGDDVFAGSINENGVLSVRVTKPAGDTTLARIIRAVEEAQASRGPTESFIDRFAQVYTPVVIVGAVLVFLLPPLIGLGAWSVWFYRGLALLVIACPCALVISTPVSVVSGLAGAARGGVLMKGGLHLENIGSVTTVVFDKTGTLTRGQPEVTDVISLSDLDESSALRLAAALEHGSEHSLGRAVVAESRRRGIDPPETHDFTALPGRGVRGTVEKRAIRVGNERYCREEGVWNEQVEAALRRLESTGKVAVVLFDEQQPLAVIAMADQVREDAESTLTALREMGIHRVMLTGDNRQTAGAVADELGIEEFYAERLPEEKVQIVQQLASQGAVVAFVGDGVNDAPALAAATVGIAMGAAGTDVALETADVALMADDLSHIEFAIALSRKTQRIVKQNVVFSIAIKIVVAVLAVIGWATLWMAVVADMGSSLAVTANGLRARWR